MKQPEIEVIECVEQEPPMYMAEKHLGDGISGNVYQAYVQRTNDVNANANVKEHKLAVKVYNPFASCNKDGRPAIEFGLL